MFAGPLEGTAAVLIEHLITRGEWQVSVVSSMEEAEDLLGSVFPDVLVAVWTSHGKMKSRVTALRSHPAGQRLPVILIGTPPEGGNSRPYEPVRGVLCLPRPLNWRTLLLCLEEHRRALHLHRGSRAV
ncbi:MAG TPA: hypothetical protein VG796_30105 [Verrucomicrobiales bacterium]|nr:hypothetical protein [Verrucomicrobiales bacterium]